MWVMTLGLMVTVNILAAFCARGAGPSRLALWLGASFAISLLIEMPHRIDPPWLMALLAALDAAITVGCALTARRYREVAWTFWPMAFINMAFLGSHILGVVAPSYFRLYLAGLDVLFLMQLVFSGIASVRNGMEISNMLPYRRRFHGSSVAVRVENR